eukprot:1157830-Amphidinium_carterae.1
MPIALRRFAPDDKDSPQRMRGRGRRGRVLLRADAGVGADILSTMLPIATPFVFVPSLILQKIQVAKGDIVMVGWAFCSQSQGDVH